MNELKSARYNWSDGTVPETGTVSTVRYNWCDGTVPEIGTVSTVRYNWSDGKVPEIGTVSTVRYNWCDGTVPESVQYDKWSLCWCSVPCKLESKEQYNCINQRISPLQPVWLFKENKWYNLTILLYYPGSEPNPLALFKLSCIRWPTERSSWVALRMFSTLTLNQG